MGILNVTPDSFSDGGNYDSMAPAMEHALRMFDEGAAIVDIGGESTRPGADPVDAESEMKRVLPVIEAILRQRPQALLSIDTSKALVARAACEAGASIINDVTGLKGDPEMVAVVAETGAGLVIMHAQGTPQTMQECPSYENVVKEVREFFQQQIRFAVDAGVNLEAIALDPGIGFRKNDEHNAELLSHLPQLMIDSHPLLIGISRKSFIGRLLNQPDSSQRSASTVALTALTRSKGALIHRVHEVRPNYDALLMAEAVMGRGSTLDGS